MNSVINNINVQHSILNKFLHTPRYKEIIYDVIINAPVQCAVFNSVGFICETLYIYISAVMSSENKRTCMS